LNGTSDLPWERIDPSLFALNPDVTFYDYTKIAGRFRGLPANYHLTFSRSETNDRIARSWLILGAGNVAVVFDTPKGRALPSHWNGFPVIDGDTDDLRFLDPKGVVVGLRAKGKARKGDEYGFVVKVAA
jgi:hypothetical protein